MSKFYAVKSGRQTGIFRTWSECEQQVKGYKCAVYKSFKTLQEAEQFLSPSSQPGLQVAANVITIYTDGSHQRSKNYLGIGAWCEHQGETYELSQQCDLELLATYGITNPEVSSSLRSDIDLKISSPTAEFIAFTEVLRHLHGIPNTWTVIFKIDYVGVGNWVRGDWQTSEPHIKKILSVARQLICLLDCHVKIEYVPGHSNNIGNDHADRLAKSHLNHNNFHLLIVKLRSCQ